MEVKNRSDMERDKSITRTARADILRNNAANNQRRQAAGKRYDRNSYDGSQRDGGVRINFNNWRFIIV